jgi:hypothetical protein
MPRAAGVCRKQSAARARRAEPADLAGLRLDSQRRRGARLVWRVAARRAGLVSPGRRLLLGPPRAEAYSDPYIARVYDRPDNWERAAPRAAPAETARLHPKSDRARLGPAPVAAYVRNVGPYTVAELEDCLDAQRLALSPHELRWLSLDE